ncbi:MAG: radical SAM protein [Desulfobacteraceae bacterium]|nr:radical SAM protein [Desulfobacteraceae bacterium]MBC2755224.1 radical SAM protein [Desulfobacteraceae bacterium]
MKDKIDPNNTYCPYLWTDIFIDQDSSVYSCCHYNPTVLGNLYTEKLENICNNSIIKRFRKESLEGRLKCHKCCTLLNKKESEITPRPKTLIIRYRDLKHLKILFGESCNLNCIMCWQDSKSRQSLDFKRLIKNLDISPFENIYIQGGEPLFIKSAKLFFDYATSCKKRASFLTNGTLINDEWAQKISRYSESICFSLNAATKVTHELVNCGSNWERVIRNINHIRETRSRFQTDVKIKGHMTIVKENLNEIHLFIKLFEAFGLDEIDFGFDWRVHGYLRIHNQAKRDLKLKIKEALAQCDTRLVKTHRLKLLELI